MADHMFDDHFEPSRLALSLLHVVLLQMFRPAKGSGSIIVLQLASIVTLLSLDPPTQDAIPRWRESWSSTLGTRALERHLEQLQMTSNLVDLALGRRSDTEDSCRATRNLCAAGIVDDLSTKP